MEVTAVMVRENGRWVIRLTVPQWMLEDLALEAETDTALVQIAAIGNFGVSYHLPMGENTYTGNTMFGLQSAVKLEPVWDKSKR